MEALEESVRAARFVRKQRAEHLQQLRVQLQHQRAHALQLLRVF